MIGKQEKGRSFRGCLRYVLEKKGAQFLGGSMLGESVDELTAEFNAIRRLRPGLEVAVYHAMLALPAHERQSDDRWLAIAHDYLNRMGFGNCQYIVVRHTDEEHDHVHLVVSRIQIPDAQTVSDSQDYVRSENVIRELERIYNLEPVTPSYEQIDRAPTTGEIRKFEKQQRQFEEGSRDKPPDPCIRLVLQSMVKHLSQQKLTMPQFIEQMQARGVEIRVGLTKGQELGITYGFGSQHYSGTQLGRGYTFQGLQKYQEIDYEPERDDAAIRRLCDETNRTEPDPAAVIAADGRANADSAKDEPGAGDLEAAIRSLNFAAPAASATATTIGIQQPRYAAEARDLHCRIEEFLEQEAVESLEGYFEGIDWSLKFNQRESDTTDAVRRAIESFDRYVATKPEQFTASPSISGPNPPLMGAGAVEELDWDDWNEQRQQREQLYSDYCFYSEQLDNLNNWDVLIAMAAIDDEKPEDDLFWMLTNSPQAKSIEYESGQTEAVAYIQNTLELAQAQLQRLLQEQLRYSFTQDVRRNYRQKYYEFFDSLANASEGADVSDVEVAKAMLAAGSERHEVGGAIAQGYFARRAAYQQGIGVWESYVNTTVHDAENKVQPQTNEVSQKLTNQQKKGVDLDL
ncbi:relaxase/mobilization nuclease domain-containing protein [Leptolyngbya ohadii]|uniref:relaxase/mobilization nuclease domain-containing protein n=1 Tax=Leptolyngbya ohadii TaxID=1962290 RepID=UPI000B5A1901|nr:relaxase/mobilization nuclease domain-containing protein [Leptolyngbya ohadii]